MFMKYKFIFNVCAFLGMSVMMLTIVSFLKNFGAYVSSRHIIIMIGIILSFSWFAEVFFKMRYYLLIEDGLRPPWMRN